MTNEPNGHPFIDSAHHRRLWEERRAEFARDPETTLFTVRATVEVKHDFLKEARVRTHRFRSDEAKPGGGDEAPNPLGYFVAAVGF
jgi:hypothetical protein